MRRPPGLAVVLMGVLMAATPASGAVQVARMISLVVDVSASIDENEYRLQMDGWAEAIREASANIESYGAGIAFNMVMFSTRSREVVPWTLVGTPPGAVAPSAFADQVALVERPTDLGENTRVARALRASKRAIEATMAAEDGFTSSVVIIDVSGDGSENIETFEDVAIARDEALEVASRINALTVGGRPSVFNFYRDYVTGGSGSFVVEAADFDAFAEAAILKIGRETGGEVPEPGRAVFSLLGLMGALAVRRRPRKA